MAESNIIPFQPLLPQTLPTISGNLDYREFRDQLLRLDLLLQNSGLEARFLQLDLQDRKLSPKAQQNRQLHAVRALRCILARLILQEDYRAFAAHLADSALLQSFCRLSRVDLTTIPSKSTLQRYDSWWSEKEVRQLVGELLAQGAAAPAPLHLPEAVDLASVFLDTTCLAAPIHYPVDWVLLRDATRTLTKAIVLIRDQGLKHRMPAPESFLSGSNKLCIAMAQAGPPQGRAAGPQSAEENPAPDGSPGGPAAGPCRSLPGPAGPAMGADRVDAPDWECFRDSAPADAQLLPRSLGRLEAVFGPRIKAAAADRGFDSELNRQGLASDGIYNAVCPRNPKQLEEKAGSWKFQQLQRRRAQTEGRIAILKNAFLGPAMRRKGFAHRELLVTWTVLTHNLWVMVRWQAQAAPAVRREAA